MWVFQSKRPTKRIESDDKKFYIVIQQLSQGDRDDIQDILASMDIVGKDEKQLAKMNLGKMKAFQRKASIVEWNLVDENGAQVPLNDENLRNLPPGLAELIDEAIDELNPSNLSDSKKK